MRRTYGVVLALFLIVRFVVSSDEDVDVRKLRVGGSVGHWLRQREIVAAWMDHDTPFNQTIDQWALSYRHSLDYVCNG